MAAVNRGQCARNRGCSTAQAKPRRRSHRTPLTPKVEITDGDYDALAGAIRNAGCDPPDPPYQLTRCIRDLFSRRFENIEFFGFVLPNLVLFYQNRLLDV